MTLVTRAQWGARPPRNRTALAKNQQRGTAVHYTASDADEQALHGNCARRVRAIQDFHMDGRGWSDIAYSYLACKHGFLYEGRGRGVRTAANGTDAGNDAYHAVCFLGDDTAGRDDVTSMGRQAIADGVAFCNAWAGVREVRPHSSFKSTACPGDELRAWIAAGMPLTPEEEPLTPEDKTWIETKLDKYMRDGVRFTDHGDDTVPGAGNHLKLVREELAAFRAAVGARLDAIEELLTPDPTATSTTTSTGDRP